MPKFGKNTTYYFLKLKTGFLPICRREILLSGEILKVEIMDTQASVSVFDTESDSRHN